MSVDPFDDDRAVVVDGLLGPDAVARALDALGPAFVDRAGSLLPALLGALLAPLADVDELVARGDGWDAAFDLERSPRPGWLGQFAGVPFDPDLTRDQQIAAVRGRGQSRGTVDALVAAAQGTLVGERLVQVDERDGSPYRLTVRTVTHETTSVAGTRAAVAAVKPVGLVLRFGWLLRPDDAAGWDEDVAAAVYACPVPADDLFPSEGLFPC